MSMLRCRWPKAFCAPPKPLQIGITERILAASVTASESEIRAALHRWTNRDGYLAALGAGIERIDLDGLPVGQPDPSHSKFAKKKLGERRLAKQAQSRP